MNRTTRWATSGLVVAGLATAGFAASGLASADALQTGGRSSSTTLNFTGQELASAMLGESTQVSADRITSGAETIGFAAIHCAFDFAAGKATCDIGAALAQGMLYARITVDPDNNVSSGTVTGGTGAYDGAKGTVTGGPGSSPDQTEVTIVYTAPHR